MQGNGDYSPNYEMIKSWVKHMNEKYDPVSHDKKRYVDCPIVQTPVNIVHTIGVDQSGTLYRVEWKVV
jgi:hypothetical protein